MRSIAEMTSPATRARARAVIGILGLDRTLDLWLTLWPALWATWLASGGAPDLSSLLALAIALVLTRCALRVWHDPDGPDLAAIGPQRRHLGAGLFVAALCFAVPLGWVALYLLAAMAIAFGWYRLRLRSYMAQPLLAAAVSLAVPAAWLAQGAGLDKVAALALLAAYLWALGVVIVLGGDRGATLKALLGEYALPAVALLQATALAALYFMMEPAALGVFFRLGLLGALVLTGIAFYRLRRGEEAGGLSAVLGWGAAVFGGIAAHFLCSCAVT